MEYKTNVEASSYMGIKINRYKRHKFLWDKGDFSLIT